LSVEFGLTTRYSQYPGTKKANVRSVAAPCTQRSVVRWRISRAVQKTKASHMMAMYATRNLAPRKTAARTSSPMTSETTSAPPETVLNSVSGGR
jgi:hypothetical protein